jgi:hypothetical protein
MNWMNGEKAGAQRRCKIAIGISENKFESSTRFEKTLLSSAITSV